MYDEETKLYENVIERYKKRGIFNFQHIILEQEKEIIYYRNKIKRLEEQLDKTGELFQATVESSLETTIEAEEGDTVIIIKSGQKIASCDVYFQEENNDSN